MKVLVCGGRDFKDRGFVERILNEQHAVVAFTHLIHGDYRGVDTFAKEWAMRHGVQPCGCPALWDYYKEKGRVRAAGPIRNRRMAELEPSLVIAFPGGDGTQGMVDIATEMNIQVFRFDNRLSSSAESKP